MTGTLKFILEFYGNHKPDEKFSKKMNEQNKNRSDWFEYNKYRSSRVARM
jgi:hypothetical protein